MIDDEADHVHQHQPDRGDILDKQDTSANHRTIRTALLIHGDAVLANIFYSGR